MAAYRYCVLYAFACNYFFVHIYGSMTCYSHVGIWPLIVIIICRTDLLYSMKTKVRLNFSQSF